MLEFEKQFIKADCVIIDYEPYNLIDLKTFQFITNEIERKQLKILVDYNAFLESNSNDDIKKSKYLIIKRLLDLKLADFVYVKEHHIFNKAKDYFGYWNVLILTNDDKIVSKISQYLLENKHYVNEQISVFRLISDKLTNSKLFDSFRGDYDNKPYFEYCYGQDLTYLKIEKSISGAEFNKLLEKNNKVNIDEKLYESSESIIYKIKDRDELFKHFKLMLDPVKLKKLQKMVDYRNISSNLAWPLTIIKNENKIVVGYTMKHFNGVTLRQHITELMNNKNLNLSEVVKLTISKLIEFLNLVKFMHSHNLLIGDINAKNVLIGDQVYIIDALSFQVNNYSLFAKTKSYLPPEILNSKRTFLLRSFGNESYSILILLRFWLTPLYDEVFINNLSVEQNKILQTMLNDFKDIEGKSEYQRLTIIGYLEFFSRYAKILNII
jgi:hypothetical protein